MAKRPIRRRLECIVRIRFALSHGALLPCLAQQTTTMRRRCDRPQAKRGANHDKPTDHHPPRLPPRPDEAYTRPPANRSAADLATSPLIIIAARSGAARRSESSCLTGRRALPARQPQRGRTSRQLSDHHRRAKQRGQTRRKLLFCPQTHSCNKPNWKFGLPRCNFKLNSNAALSRAGRRTGFGEETDPASA